MPELIGKHPGVIAPVTLAKVNPLEFVKPASASRMSGMMEVEVVIREGNEDLKKNLKKVVMTIDGSSIEAHLSMNNMTTNRRQFREVIQLFIEGKMNCYATIVVKADCGMEEVHIEETKYRASLFMIHRMLKTMDHEEIAAALGIACPLLNEWENEKWFRTLVYSNYKEFLMHLGELYT